LARVRADRLVLLAAFLLAPGCRSQLSSTWYSGELGAPDRTLNAIIVKGANCDRDLASEAFRKSTRLHEGESYRASIGSWDDRSFVAIDGREEGYLFLSETVAPSDSRLVALDQALAAELRRPKRPGETTGQVLGDARAVVWHFEGR
jgi:hypothetical protein